MKCRIGNHGIIDLKKKFLGILLVSGLLHLGHFTFTWVSSELIASYKKG